MEKRIWPRSAAVPIILIALGIALLLGNVFKLEIWDILIRLWPVWLIAIGLDLLIGRQNRWASIAVAAVTLTMTPSALLSGAAGRRCGPHPRSTRQRRLGGGAVCKGRESRVPPSLRTRSGGSGG